MPLASTVGIIPILVQSSLNFLDCSPISLAKSVLFYWPSVNYLLIDWSCFLDEGTSKPCTY